MALMVCVKETATLPRLTLVKRFPRVCTIANGTIAKSCLPVRVVGRVIKPVAHPSSAITVPPRNWKLVLVQG